MDDEELARLLLTPSPPSRSGTVTYYEMRRLRGWWWGQARENGVWLATARRRRLLWRGHDSLYVAAGRFRLRLVKPWRAK